jgi:hypothetical protein
VVAAPEAVERQKRAEALEEELAQVTGALNATAGRMVVLIAKVLETESWAGYGIRSPEHWVAWRCGVSPGRARQLVAMARRLSELPETRAGLEAGELSEDQVAVICRLAPVHADSAIAAFARHATVAQLRRVLADYAYGDAQGTDGDAEPGDATTPRRSTSFGHGDDGLFRLWACLAPEEGALLERALEAARSSLYDTAGTPEARRDVSWADSLVEMAERSLNPAASARPHHDRHMVLVHLDANGSHLHLGPALPNSLRRYLSCDAWVCPVVDREAVATSVGRALRIVPHRTRIAVEERDRGCRVPGCDRSRWLEVHHVRHWEDGGPTDTCNLVALCSFHHRLHHKGLLGIFGNADDPDGLVFTDTRGRRLTGNGRPAPPAKLPLGGTWSPPSGERLNPHWVYFG